jgi:hypothetical protein
MAMANVFASLAVRHFTGERDRYRVACPSKWENGRVDHVELELYFLIDFTGTVMRAFFFSFDLPMEKKMCAGSPVCKFVCMLSSAHAHMFAAWIVADAIGQDGEEGDVIVFDGLDVRNFATQVHPPVSSPC